MILKSDNMLKSYAILDQADRSREPTLHFSSRASRHVLDIGK